MTALSALPLPYDFCWATGIEDTFIPQTRPGLRRMDEYELTQHYDLWQSDFDRVAETGVQYVRWGLPWYRVQPAPDCWDWTWTDRALDYLINVKGITPILDLMHYGTPLWLENSFLNSSYPQRVAEFAAAVAGRYGSLVRYYTPLNEPQVTAEFCGRRGEWPPYLHGEDGHVRVLLAVARGIVLTCQALRSVQPEAVLVQVEALWRQWSADPAPEVQAQVALANQHPYLSWDLTTGRVDEGHPLWPYLATHGVTAADLDCFRHQAVNYDIFGANFYPWSYAQMARGGDGKLHPVPGRTPGAALGEAVCDAYQRYGVPVMVTETSANAGLEERARWMDETIAAIRGLREQGLPVVGYTWFPLFAMIDWRYRTGRRSLADYIITLGLYDAQFDAQGTLQRIPTPLLDRYRDHMACPMPPVKDLAIQSVSS